MQYIGRDHVRAAYSRSFTDRVPVYPITSLINAKVAGMTIKEYLTDPKKFAKAVIASHERFQGDVVTMMADLVMETEACGSAVAMPEDDLAYVTKHILDDKKNLLKMKVPDPMQDARLPYYIEGLSRARPHITDAAAGSVICGPWQIAVNLRGAEQIILDTVDDPEFVHDLMKFTTEFAQRFGMAINTEARVGLSYSEAACSLNLISPDIYRTFVLPYHQELVEYFSEKRTGVTLHICGYIDPIMEDIVATGVSALSIDCHSSLKKLMKVSNRKLVIIGNVDILLFKDGTKKQIEDAAKWCIDTVAPFSAFVLSSACEIPPTAPLENIDHFIKFAHEYGRYDRIVPGWIGYKI
ncbi:MAG: uroporphyrinogen decarboxylase family protein [Thermodesulfobacteriota bacterium]